MADRFPLIANSSANQIQELPAADNLNLANNSIVGVVSVTATTFYGSGANLTGIDATSIKHTDGNVKVQANAVGAVVTGIATITGNAFVGGNLLPDGDNDADLDAEQNPDTDDQGNTIAEYLNAIKWSRFGNFAITKWSGSGWIE